MSVFAAHALTVFVSLCLAGAANASDETHTVRLGIMSFTGNSGFTTHIADEDRLLQAVPAWLQKHVPEIRIEAAYYRMNDLMKAVEKKEVDIFLGSSGLFWQLKHTGARDLATIVSDQTPNPNEGVAGVIFVKRNRDDLKDIADLRGLSVSTGMSNMFLASQLSMAAVAEQGYDPEKFFRVIRRHDLPYPSVINDVKEGRTDVGMIRACVLENEFPDWEKDFKIISRRPDERFHCARSTDAYPNFTIASTSGFDPELTRRIALALLSMPSNGPGGYHWGLATEFEKVDRVARLLKTDGYSYLKEWTISRIWKEYRNPLLIVLAGLLLFVLHVVRVEVLVDRRTEELREEMKRRMEAEESARAIEQKLEVTEKLSVVGQLSSLFAHELRQPLATAQYLNDGIRVMLRRGRLSDDKLAKCTDGISDQIEKIDAIIEKVRSYAKQSPDRSGTVKLSELLGRIAERMKPRMHSSFTVNLRNC